jgi:hypothetical protein
MQNIADQPVSPSLHQTYFQEINDEVQLIQLYDLHPIAGCYPCDFAIVMRSPAFGRSKGLSG